MCIYAMNEHILMDRANSIRNPYVFLFVFLDC